MTSDTKSLLVAALTCGACLALPTALLPNGAPIWFGLSCAATYGLRLRYRLASRPGATRFERTWLAAFAAPLEAMALVCGWVLVFSMIVRSNDPLVFLAAPFSAFWSSLILAPCVLVGTALVRMGGKDPPSEGLHCPRCHYRVDNLPAMRCPECGTVYTQDLPPSRA